MERGGSFDRCNVAATEKFDNYSSINTIKQLTYDTHYPI